MESRVFDIPADRGYVGIRIHSPEELRQVEVVFYGVRGSIPTPLTGEQVFRKVSEVSALVLENALEGKLGTRAELAGFLSGLGFGRTCTFGGNSPCVEVLAGNGDRLILDAGSGIRPLGLGLMKTDLGKGKGRADILFSHFHFDHIQGLPFFVPVYIPGNKITYYGGVPDVLEIMKGQFRAPYFPVEWETLSSTQEGVTLVPGEPVDIAGFKVSIHPLNHPNKSFAYRIERDGKSLVYATDSEFMDRPAGEYDAYKRFFADADCLIVDAQYAILDSMTSKFGWGHSSYNIDIDLAKAAGVKTMYFFHYDPVISDEEIERVFREAMEYRDGMHPDCGLKLGLSREGLKIKI
jgi:phosphoribosyl 1,2-cyclic phosphodiesterase